MCHSERSEESQFVLLQEEDSSSHAPQNDIELSSCDLLTIIQETKSWQNPN